jgi:hypothetical protein
LSARLERFDVTAPITFMLAALLRPPAGNSAGQPMQSSI